MTQAKKIYKIQLKGGDTVRHIFDFIAEHKGAHICFVLDRNFLLVTESSFLKKLKLCLETSETKALFVTTKSYFQKLLSSQGFKVSEKETPPYRQEPLKTMRDFSDRVKATKNEEKLDFETHKINFTPKIGSTSTKPQFSTKPIQNLARERSLRGVYFFILIFLIGLLGLVFFLISPRAEIVIKPRISTIETNQNIIVALPGAEVSEQDNQLPMINGVLVETSITDEVTFPSTDKTYDLTNSRGKITLFNETEIPKFLVASRLKDRSGVVLKMQEAVTIPPRKNGKPGEAVVEVVAEGYDEEEKPIGDRGNLEAGTKLFFPALRKESQELYYGKVNKGPLVGGSTLTHYFIGAQDFDLAKPLLEQSFLVQGTENLKEELKSRSRREKKKYILLEQQDLLFSELTDYQYPADLVGHEVSTFSVEGTLKVAGIVFDQDQVVKFLTQKIKEKQDHRKKIIKIDKNSVGYRVLDSTFLDEQRFVKLSVSMIGVETLDFEAKNEFALSWQQKIKNEILGKNVDQARGILINHPEIESIVEFKLSPFWIQNVPRLLDQIKMKIDF